MFREIQYSGARLYVNVMSCKFSNFCVNSLSLTLLKRDKLRCTQVDQDTFIVKPNKCLSNLYITFVFRGKTRDYLMYQNNLKP